MKKVLFFLIVPIFSLFCESEDISTLSDRKIIKALETSIETRDRSIVDTLELLTKKDNYQKFENYILESAKELIDQDDLEYPLFLVESILTVNLESKGAQDLYVSIVNRKIDIEDRKILEEERKVEKEEALKELAEEIEEESEVQDELSTIVEENKEVIFNVTKNFDLYKERRYINNTYFYPFSDVFYSSEAYAGYYDEDVKTNKISGFGIEMGLGLSFEKLVFRFDFGGNLASNQIFSNETKHIFTYSNLSFGLKSISIPLFLRSGFLYSTYLSDDEISPVAVTSLPSSTLGVGINGFKMFKVLKLDASFDFLTAPLYTQSINAGILSKLYLILNLYRFNSYNIELKGGFDYLWLDEEGLSETNFNPKIGLGFSRYE